MAVLRVGQVDYANCLPIYYGLEKLGYSRQYEIVRGVPSRLNRMLLEGKLDTTPMSSFEYAANSEQCLILPDLSISSDGEVGSIFLFSKKPVEELAGEIVSLTSSSATSVALLKVLLRLYFRVECRYVTAEPDLRAMLTDATAALLIGDDAMVAAYNPAAFWEEPLFVYDLGELWKRFTGEKMVFALWTLHREMAAGKKKEIKELARAFEEAKAYGLTHLEEVVPLASGKTGLPEEIFSHYFTLVRYDLDESFCRGLKSFYDHAYEAGLLPRRVQLYFWEE
ncbi:MAG: chorismate dehydratase [Eubacteriales bacterium]|nr:chorismate dehydratase [Eubacteriales bacterium]